MGNAKAIDVSHIRFASTLVPSAEDMKLWHSLSAEEQRAVVKRDLDEAEASGIADPDSVRRVAQRVRE